jgi:hypothetical protein
MDTAKSSVIKALKKQDCTWDVRFEVRKEGTGKSSTLTVRRVSKDNITGTRAVSGSAQTYQPRYDRGVEVATNNNNNNNNNNTTQYRIMCRQGEWYVPSMTDWVLAKYGTDLN